MAGGIGSRFWPMSTPEVPKQFIDVLGTGRTMIQMTYDRFCKGEGALCKPQNVWIVTSEKYVDLVRGQLPEVPEANILPEPASRNTAPCIAYACWKIARVNPDSNIVVSPADAFVLDSAEYRRVIGTALSLTASSTRIFTVGIKPLRPETGYGYIETGEALGEEAFKVTAFKEKPDAPTAAKYIRDGRYLWNAGIFVWKLSTITAALREYAPGICSIMDRIAESFGTPDESAVLGELFPQCEKISIDYAVMEKSPDIYTIPGDFGWSDLGTWGSLKANLPQDRQNNAVVSSGSAELWDCKNCIVHVDGLRRVVLDALDGYIVAERDGRLLVCPLSDEQKFCGFSSNRALDNG